MATATYPFPPQFQNIVPAPEAYMKGLGLGTQVKMQREQIQAQRDIAAMQAQLRAQEQAAENARAAQRLEIEKAYKDTYLNLQEQELRRKQAEDEIQMQQAAQKYAMQQEWNRGPQPGETWEKFALRVGPLVTGSMAGTADLYEKAYGKPFTPTMLTIPGAEPGTGTTLIQTAKDRWIPAPPDAEEAKQVTIDGVKYLRTRGASGQYDYQQVKENPPGQQLVNGGIQAAKIWKAGTTNVPVPGLMAVPTAEGWTTRNSPLGAASLIDRQITRMEEEFGADILRGDREPKGASAKRLEGQLPKLRKQYAELRKALDASLSEYLPDETEEILASPGSWPKDQTGRVLVTSPEGVKGSLPQEQVPAAVRDKKYKIGWN